MYLRSVSLLLILSFAAACTSAGDDSNSPPTSAVAESAVIDQPNVDDFPAYLFLIDELPATFPAQALAACSFEQGGGRGSLVGYRGIDHVDSEEYTETPFIRLSVVPKNVGATTPDFTAEDAANKGDPDSSFETDVSGLPAIGFTISTAEPILTPWPAVSWEVNDVVLLLLGEGMSRAEVITAANSVRAVDSEEFEAAGVRNNDVC